MAGLAVLGMAAVTSCKDIKNDIAELKYQIAEMQSVTIASIDKQLASIKTSISDLQNVDMTLRTEIEVLNIRSQALRDSIEACEGRLSAKDQVLQDQLIQVGVAVGLLKEEDTKIKSTLTQLQNYFELALRDEKEWVETTFATIDQFKAVSAELESVKSEIVRVDTTIAAVREEFKEAIVEAINVSESSMKNWVNDELTKVYSSISAVEARIDEITAGGATKEDITALENKITDLDTTITAAYHVAIREAIETNNGVIAGVLRDSLYEVNTRITDEVSRLDGRIDAIEERLAAVEDTIASLLARIQTITYIPEYSDGMATVSPMKIAEMSFVVSPASAAVKLAELWEEGVSVKAVLTRTRAVSELIDLPVLSFTATASGIVTARAYCDALGSAFFAGTQTASAALFVSDGNSSVSSEFVNLTPGEGPDAPEGALKGVYSVSASGKRVFFAKGNLWLGPLEENADTTWNFEQNQYSSQPVKDTTEWNAGHKSHFYWEKTGEYGSEVICVTPEGDSTDTVDWGEVYNRSNSTSGWRTLSAEEWDYVINRRQLASGKPSFKKYTSEGGFAGIKGICIYPDNYAGNADEKSFEELAEAGIVFLPFAGTRFETMVSSITENSTGYYWTSTADGKDSATGFVIGVSSTEIRKVSRNSALSVRLVIGM